MITNCSVCGAPFEVTGSQKTCSPACAKERDKARRREIDRAKREGWYEPKSLRARSPKSPRREWIEPHRHPTLKERDDATHAEAAWIMCQA